VDHPRRDHRLDGRRIIVGGASSGIGAAVAAACVTAGARTALFARRADRLQEVAAALVPSAYPIRVDLTDRAQVEGTVATAVDQLGGVDCLVNVAGLNRAGPFAEGDPEHWQEMLSTNVHAAMMLTHAVLPHLHQSGGGDVVTIGSAAATGDRSGTSAVYAATKAAVAVWGASLDAELAAQGVRVMTISPGTVRTEFATATPDDELRRVRAERFRRTGLDPDVVAAQVVHVLSQPRSVLVSQLVITPMPTSDER
jgi:3-hydroxy acid dehydrogenase/malonic semialdehyde reductase